MEQPKLEYLEVTCPTCRTEIEVKVPEGVVYQTDMAGWIHANKRVVDHTRTIWIDSGISQFTNLKHKMMLKQDSAGLFTTGRNKTLQWCIDLLSEAEKEFLETKD